MPMLALLTMLALGLQQPSSPSTAQTGSIRVVTRLNGTEAPLPDVEVNVFPQQGGRSSSISRARTDAGGSARFDNLPLGNYFVQAESAGYIGGDPIRPMPNPAGRAPAVGTVTLTNSDIRSIVLYFRRAGSISGQARDSARIPLANARVSLLALSYSYGRRTLLEASTTITDADGRYSLKALPDGTYYIRLQSAQSGFDVYYPSVLEADRAAPVLIRDGENIGNIEVAIPEVRTFKVSGTIVNSPGKVPAFTISPIGSMDVVGTNSPSLPNRIDNSTSRFEISGVPAGAWNLFPVVPLKEGEGNVDAIQAIARPNATGHARIDVVDHNLDNVVIVVVSASLEMRVRLKGPATDPMLDLRRVRVSLIPQDNIPRTLLGGEALGQTADETGLLLFSYLPPGTYGIWAAATPPGWYVSDVLGGVRSILSEGRITIGVEPVPPLEIDLRSDGGTIRGVLDGSAVTAPGDKAEPVIALVPQAQFQRESLLLYKTTTLTGGPAEFTFRDIAPGNYKVIAWKHAPPGDPSKNPEFVARYEGFGTSVSVKSGETSTVRVQLIPEGN